MKIIKNYNSGCHVELTNEEYAEIKKLQAENRAKDKLLKEAVEFLNYINNCVEDIDPSDGLYEFLQREEIKEVLNDSK